MIINVQKKEIKEYLDRIMPDGIVLTGGNDIGQYPARDNTELLILEYAKENKIPLLAICRGMQLLAYNEGVKLLPVTGHVGKKHIVTGEINQEVICFHNFSIYETQKLFKNCTAKMD